MTLPFDGAISQFFERHTPEHVKDAIRSAQKGAILSSDYPHQERLKRRLYDEQMHKLQVELVKMQSWIRASNTRIICVFEGRDAAGKGGTIKRLRANLNPRSARVVALSKPSQTQASQWYFQRYINHLPAAGELVSFDRSWYNRAVVEYVFGFCTGEQRRHFFTQVNPFEEMLADDGVQIFKFWLNVSRAEQLRRMLAREDDPLKQWKLSSIDVQGLSKWDAYSDAIYETLSTTHHASAPWRVVRSDDKRRARLNVIRSLLAGVAYEGRDLETIGQIDETICAGPEIWTDKNWGV